MFEVTRDGGTTEVWYDKNGCRCTSATRILDADEISAIEEQISQGQTMTLDELDEFIESKRRLSAIGMFLHPIRTFKRLKALHEGEEVSLM